MDGQARRNKIIEIVKKSDKPVSGTFLAEQLGVSRQVVVTDIALIRANGVNIISTNRGYIINSESGSNQIVDDNISDYNEEEDGD